MIQQYCKSCGKPTNGAKKTGYCRECYATSDEYRQTMRESALKPKTIKLKSKAATNQMKPGNGYREAHSERMKAYWADPHSWVNTFEYRAKLSKSHKSRMERPDQQEQLAKARDAWRSPSNLELLVQQALTELGINYISQYQPEGCKRFYDLYIPDMNLLLEVDGEYWHHSAISESYGVTANDAFKTQWAIYNGYAIIRVRERVIKELGALEAVRRAIGA